MLVTVVRVIMSIIAIMINVTIWGGMSSEFFKDFREDVEHYRFWHNPDDIPDALVHLGAAMFLIFVGTTVLGIVLTIIWGYGDVFHNIPGTP